jgi:predicted ribosome quality control (RQC) complex YloA/Tae2 family protein
MLSNYHTLGYLASLLKEDLTGRRISQIFTQNSEEMVIGFEPDVPVLVFSCQAETNALYLHDRYARARLNSVDVLAGAVGRTVMDVLIHPADRVIILLFASGRVLLQFFGARANALLLDASNLVIDSFLPSRHAPGTVLQERTTEVVYDLAGLPGQLQASGMSLLSPALRSALPALGPTLLRELLHRASLSPSASAAGLKAPEIARLTAELRALMQELAAPRCRVYSDAHGAPAVFSLIPLRHLSESQVREFDDPHAALRAFVGRRRSTAEIGQQLTALRTPLRHQRDRLQRSLHAMEAEAQEAERAADYERTGTLLLQHIHEIQKGDAVALLDGEHIPLDRALTPARNAQRFFEKAKRSRTAAAEKAARIGPARQRLASATALLEELDNVSSPEEFRLFQQKNAASLDLFGLSEKAKQRAEIPFRTFTVEGGFDVWVGKSSENNDLLTIRHAKPEDLWFHARGSSGSHVVLRIASSRGDPGKRALEQAAAIAAYFSKMKHASVVPVAMTKRKYVRKPKGAPAGSVVIERERVLFVAPALPPEHS